MDRSEFLARVAEGLGTEPVESLAVCQAVLSALGTGLSRAVAQTVAGDLPEALGRALLAGPHGRALPLEELYLQVGRSTGAGRGEAVEQVVVVCQVLAESLRPQLVALMQQDLPGPAGALLRWSEPVQEATVVHRDPASRTLAEGRPGSRHPLYSAGADRAQRESVVRAANPHGDTKLSSARGLTQEREKETLAEGQPGSGSPLSSSRPGGGRKS